MLGLKKLLETVDSRYQLPSRSPITRLPELYTDIKAKLQKQLDTTDIWTSLQTKSYCCVTAHYITSNWELKSALLETFEFNAEHTAAHIAAELVRVTKELEYLRKNRLCRHRQCQQHGCCN